MNIRRSCHVLALTLALVPFAAYAQSKPATGGLGPAKLCADPFQVNDRTVDVLPEAPVQIFFHRENSKAAWAANSAIKVPGVQAATPATAKTLVCVTESRLEVGDYESGAKAYSLVWDVALVRLEDKMPLEMFVSLNGGEPPFVKYGKGSGIGDPPLKALQTWLKVVTSRDVAERRLVINTEAFEEVSALAFSPDGTKLAVAEDPRSTGSGTPPAPVMVFDVASGKQLSKFTLPYASVRHIAVNNAGDRIALSKNGKPEVYDATGSRLITPAGKQVEAIAMINDSTAAISADGTVSLIDVNSGGVKQSVAGSQLARAKDSSWTIAETSASAISVKDLVGTAIAQYAPLREQSRFIIAGDGRSGLRLGTTFSLFMTPGEGSYGTAIELPTRDLGNFAMVRGAASLPDGVILGNTDGYVGVLRGGNATPRLFFTGQSNASIAASSDGRLVAIGDGRGKVSIWELK